MAFLFRRQTLAAFLALLASSPPEAHAASLQSADDALNAAAAAGEVDCLGGPVGHAEDALLADDECAAGSDGEACAVSALQMRGQKVRASLATEGEAQAALPEADAEAIAGVTETVTAGASSNIFEDIKHWIFGEPQRPPNHAAIQNKYPYLPPHSDMSNMWGRPRDGFDVPSNATQYNGVAWKELVFNGTDPMHVFTIADWGGLLGEFYGAYKGRHTFAISRPGCGIPDMNHCFMVLGNRSQGCRASCGFVTGVDDMAQVLVANAMRERAKQTGLQYVLNAGDNYYPLGIETPCGKPMDRIAETTKRQFEEAFQWIYYGSELAAPWLSVLGNHDYGARQFNAAWDQQIAFTWSSSRWTMPALYWSQLVRYPDQGFSVEIFMIDSNVEDAHPPSSGGGANICSGRYNAKADCSANGGPSSAEDCYGWFQDLWNRQAHWLETKLAASTADWQIVVTHFPCGHKPDFYKKLHETFGLDLMVTGHVHEQLVRTVPGGMMCLISGGGGGVTSERSPSDHMSNQYGFFDLTIAKDKIRVELVNFRGNVVSSHDVRPRAAAGDAANHVQPAPAPVPRPAPHQAPQASCAAYGCSGYRPSQPCQCNSACHKHNNCCADFSQQCAA